MNSITSYDRVDRISVVKHWLTTGPRGAGKWGTQYLPHTHWTFSILYTLCGELPLRASFGNCQGMLDRSSRRHSNYRGSLGSSDQFRGATEMVARGTTVSKRL